MRNIGAVRAQRNQAIYLLLKALHQSSIHSGHLGNLASEEVFGGVLPALLSKDQVFHLLKSDPGEVTVILGIRRQQCPLERIGLMLRPLRERACDAFVPEHLPPKGLNGI